MPRHGFAPVVLTLMVLMAGVASAQTLHVAAASSLSEAFEELARSFAATQLGVRVELTFAASSTVVHQVLHGAPAAVVASADMIQMARLYQADRLDAPPIVFAGNEMALITPLGGRVRTLRDLAETGVRVVVASPEVPAGAYAVAVIAQLAEEFGADYAAQLRANIVSEEPNVRQAAAKVSLGEADAAFVFLTDGQALSSVAMLAIPPAINVRAAYPIAVIKQHPQQNLARAFVAFVTSHAGGVILARHGFAVPPR